MELKRRCMPMGSILDTIKKMLNVPKEFTEFDVDIIVAINSAFMYLNQIGVGPENTFYIEDSTSNWTDFTGGSNEINSIKAYVFLRSRLVFDPPTNGFMVDAIERQITELEWRLQVQSERIGELPNIPHPETSPDKTHIHIQEIASKTWVIDHELNKFPSVTAVNGSDTVVYGNVSYESSSRVIVKFTESYTGRAYLN